MPHRNGNKCALCLINLKSQNATSFFNMIAVIRGTTAHASNFPKTGQMVNLGPDSFSSL